MSQISPPMMRSMKACSPHFFDAKAPVDVSEKRLSRLSSVALLSASVVDSRIFTFSGSTARSGFLRREKEEVDADKVLSNGNLFGVDKNSFRSRNKQRPTLISLHPFVMRFLSLIFSRSRRTCKSRRALDSRRATSTFRSRSRSRGS